VKITEADTADVKKRRREVTSKFDATVVERPAEEVQMTQKATLIGEIKIDGREVIKKTSKPTTQYITMSNQGAMKTSKSDSVESSKKPQKKTDGFSDQKPGVNVIAF
jgi:hypothetical protein